ncbi:cardio acceleratory peptide capability [Choristoneura fumiferana]|uniref:cardio acceleratory peptide capability n=1 Tax=Choristoneura fumiferana TaxID=7141 RepID=UPI003D159BD0
MQSITRIAVSMFLVSSAFAASYQTSAKLRRDGILNLYPFPRVGRASAQTWQVPLNDFYLEYKPSEKRQLYAFPRVGRSEPREHPNQPMLRIEDILFRRHLGPKRSKTQETQESTGPDTTGMWFGPRLGRAYKSEEDYPVGEHSEPEHIDPELNEDRKKRQANQ